MAANRGLQVVRHIDGAPMMPGNRSNETRSLAGVPPAPSPTKWEYRVKQTFVREHLKECRSQCIVSRARDTTGPWPQNPARPKIGFLSLERAGEFADIVERQQEVNRVLIEFL